MDNLTVLFIAAVAGILGIPKTPAILPFDVDCMMWLYDLIDLMYLYFQVWLALWQSWRRLALSD